MNAICLLCADDVDIARHSELGGDASEAESDSGSDAETASVTAACERKRKRIRKRIRCGDGEDDASADFEGDAIPLSPAADIGSPLSSTAAASVVVAMTDTTDRDNAFVMDRDTETRTSAPAVASAASVTPSHAVDSATAAAAGCKIIRKRKVIRCSDDDDDDDTSADSSQSIAATVTGTCIRQEKEAEQEAKGIASLPSDDRTAISVGLQYPNCSTAAAAAAAVIVMQSPHVAASSAAAAAAGTVGIQSPVSVQAAALIAAQQNRPASIPQKVYEYCKCDNTAIRCHQPLSRAIALYGADSLCLSIVVDKRTSFFITGAAGTGKVRLAVFVYHHSKSF